MSVLLAALACVLPYGQTTQPQEILTQRGRTLARVVIDTGSIHPRCWQYRLYQPNMPAWGDKFWGVVEEPTFGRVRETLVRLRKQQAAWWTWLGQPGRPEPMPYTTFNALGPIAVMDDEGWSATWGDLGPAAPRAVGSRKKRLEAARALEDGLFDLLGEKNWVEAFDSDPFRNQGVAVYQAAPVINAIITLRGFETEMRSLAPISIQSANADLDVFSSVGQRLRDVADQLAKSKPPLGFVAPAITSKDAISLLNGRFVNYAVQAGEGGPASETGTMSFDFTDSGFSLVKAPPGWYGGIEPVAYVSLDPITVRYDPQFGGPQRGGIVFQPKDDLRSSYRGPSGLLLPLGTTPREAESLAQAMRRLVRLANGEQEAPPPKDEPVDPRTEALVARFRSLADALAALGAMKFEEDELAAKAPAALEAVIAKRNGLWRDSEVGAVLQKQVAPGATFQLNGVAATLPGLAMRLGVPMNLTPTEPPTWVIERINREGDTAHIVVRQASRAMRGKGGPIFTVFRLVEETWVNAETAPHLQAMRLIAAGETQVLARPSADSLSAGFYRLGNAALDDNRLPEAERYFRRAVVMRPGWATAWNWLGVSIVRQGRVDDAAPFCYQSVQINPKYVLGLTNLADIRRVQGHVSESKDLAARAVAAAPKDAWARIVLGHACFTNGDFAEAEQHYREALKIEPGNGSTHADLAGALLRQNKVSDATSEASRAIELGWRNHWVYKELAIPKKG